MVGVGLERRVEPGDQRMIGIELERTLGLRQFLTRCAVEAFELWRHRIRVADETRRRLGEAVREAGFADVGVERLAEPGQQFLELGGARIRRLVGSACVTVEFVEIDLALGD